MANDSFVFGAGEPMTLGARPKIQKRLEARKNGREDREHADNQLDGRTGRALKCREGRSSDDRRDYGRWNSEPIALLITLTRSQIVPVPSLVRVEQPAAQEVIGIIRLKDLRMFGSESAMHRLLDQR